MNYRSIHRRHRKGITAGYTAVEVLMAITVMSIGAAAVISMQKASIQGNLDARKTDIANSIARTWVERIKRDAMGWTQPGPTTGPGNNIATAAIIQAGVTSAGQWILPDQYLDLVPPTSPGFDILGRDLLRSQIGTALFCANVRFTWLTNNELLRADVRVLWPRGISNAPPAAGVCDGTVATANAPNPLVYHAIYLTTAVRGNPQ